MVRCCVSSLLRRRFVQCFVSRFLAHVFDRRGPGLQSKPFFCLVAQFRDLENILIARVSYGSLPRRNATTPQGAFLMYDVEQIVGRERRERVSQIIGAAMLA